LILKLSGPNLFLQSQRGLELSAPCGDHWNHNRATGIGWPDPAVFVRQL